MSGGVASYVNYPEIHPSNDETFALEHMLPILGLESMVLKNSPKGQHVPNHFVPSPQFKPSDVHYYSQKNNDDGYAQHSLSAHKHTEVASAHPISSPPVSLSSYISPINIEDHLLKFGQQPNSNAEGAPQYSALVQEKPAFVKPELLPNKYNFNKPQTETRENVKTIPLNNHPGLGAGNHIFLNGESHKHHNLGHGFHPPPPSKWQEHYVYKPQIVSPLSISTSHFNVVNPNAANTHEQSHHRPHHHSYHSAPQAQTHLNFYIPKEIDTHPQSHFQQHVAQQSIPRPTVSLKPVQSEDHEIIPRQPTHEEPTEAAERPNGLNTQVLTNHQNGGHQSSYYIHKQFEFSKPNSNDNRVVTEFYGTQNRTKGARAPPQLDASSFSAQPYLPINQARPHQQLASALTLQPSQQKNQHSQKHRKINRRNHDTAKPPTELRPAVEQETSDTIQSIKTVEPAEKQPTEVKVDSKNTAQPRVDDNQEKQAATSEGSTTRPAKRNIKQR
ncbi:uncharacterized protein LOC129771821 isoform X2 [Toxorhynchites rutilus septentrionalis]|nr:uncharacterized protein LOC129771821 isoform X2 [Toxorhynchites rutilus septentrionalis]